MTTIHKHRAEQLLYDCHGYQKDPVTHTRIMGAIQEYETHEICNLVVSVYDTCRDPVTGALAPVAADFLNRLTTAHNLERENSRKVTQNFKTWASIVFGLPVYVGAATAFGALALLFVPVWVIASNLYMDWVTGVGR